MKLNPHKKLLYLITSGATSFQTTPLTEDYFDVLRLVEAAVVAEIDLVQIREKSLSVRVLYELSHAAAKTTRGSTTKLLINDRADIASTAGADGVHLTTRSLPAEVIRRAFGKQFLIGVSTHSLREVSEANEHGADFAVLGPIFQTESKTAYGEPLGLDKLRRVTSQQTSFPVLALGGVTVDNAKACVRAGASGVAAITMLNQANRLKAIADEIRTRFE